MGPRQQAALVAALVSASLLAAPGCKKKELAEPERCANDVARLREWFDALADDGVVRSDMVDDPTDPYRSLSVPAPLVSLVRLAEPPDPKPDGGPVTLQAGTVRFESGATNVRNTALLEGIVRSAAASAITPHFAMISSRFPTNPFLPLTLLVGENERWENVVAVADAAQKCGVSTLQFVFEAKSHAQAPPLDGESAKRMLAVALDSKERPSRRDAALVNELGRANPHCPDVAAPSNWEPTSGRHIDEQRKEVMSPVVDAFAGCDCRGDLAAIRAVAWMRFGRHWGPLTRMVPLEICAAPHIGPDGPPLEILAAPAAATWREAHGVVIEASKRNARVTLAVR